MTYIVSHGPQERNMKWYFAYHSVYGLIFPFMWAEEDGLCVGGRPDPLRGTKVEISEHQFSGGMADLVREHPYKGDIAVFPPSVVDEV